MTVIFTNDVCGGNRLKSNKMLVTREVSRHLVALNAEIGSCNELGSHLKVYPAIAYIRMGQVPAPSPRSRKENGGQEKKII